VTDPDPNESANERERRDEEGLPIDRAPTMDDVRGSEGSGRTIAIGCSAIVLGLILVFWLLRAYVLG
jgi:hypothetical protein